MLYDSLFVPRVPAEQWNENFRRLWFERNPWNECVIADWANGFEDRDHKFAKEFQTTFNSAFWELYLFACLKELGFTVDFGHHAPDFVIAKGSDCASIEATIASHAKGGLAEWEGELAKRMEMASRREAIIRDSIPRLSNSLSAKYRLFKESYSKLEHVKGKPFVIAIAPFEQPMGFLQTDQSIRNVLYQYDIPIFKDITEEKRRIIFGHEFVEYFIKPNGTRIELGFFLDDRMREISAVIFSNLATWGKVRALSKDPNPNILFATKRFNEGGLKARQKLVKKSEHEETLLDGLHVFLNPNAEIPLPPSMHDWPGVIYHDLGEEGIPVDTASDGSIFWRSVLTLDPKKDYDQQIRELNEAVEREIEAE